MGCSPDKGGPGDTGNGGCSRTEEKIVSGGGGLSECFQKFRTLEGRKKKKDSVNLSPCKRVVTVGKTHGLQNFACFC